MSLAILIAISEERVVGPQFSAPILFKIAYFTDSLTAEIVPFLGHTFI
jgi:hypothetical protein